MVVAKIQLVYDQGVTVVGDRLLLHRDSATCQHRKVQAGCREALAPAVQIPWQVQ